MNFGTMSQLFTAQSHLIIRCSYLKTFACQLQRTTKYTVSNRNMNFMKKGESDDKYREDQYHIGEDNDTEADFTKLHEAHYQFEKETVFNNERRDLKIAERKFFKMKKQPNLLTWEEKEQIRFLHNDDSEEWNISKLSESFPATEETIRKIIKAKWQLSDPNKIRKHNETVKKNWHLLKEGKLEISESLKKHILKFSSRERAVLPEPVSVPPPLNFLPEGGEFGSIITEYQKRKDKNEPEESKKVVKISSKTITAPNDDNFVLCGKNNKNSHHFTLDTLRKNINKRVEDGKKTSLIDLTILESVKQVEENGFPVGNLSEKSVPKSPDKEEKAVTSSKETRDVTLQHSTNSERDLIPSRITIPKHCWVRGATYKVEDRYYDYDGTFLYRVPGMK